MTLKNLWSRMLSTYMLYIDAVKYYLINLKILIFIY